MTEHLAHYRQLEGRLWVTRWKHEGEESPEEDEILDLMENVWLDLPEDERDILRSEGPRCWPMDSSSAPPDLPGIPCPPAPNAWAYEGFHSPAEASLSAEVA